ncbi:porin family protein [Capnocytophaga stomatis]|uniref:Porin family protein n=1 Tax=Capnocytophaga stomatis TaxID=1848904 RepID=A0A250FTP9_9FLAO|nr:porin family protein [Capnocytophaga stomatis]ATA88532.1 hypothetical protein CGC58_01530 [Capnocytophaga stomatis]
MKNFIIAVTVAIATIFTTQAQEVKFGARTGLNISTVSFKGSETEAGHSYNVDVETGFKTGFHVGAFAELGLSDQLFIEAGLAYSQQGATLKSMTGTFGSRTIKQDFDKDSYITLGLINLPVWLKYDIAGFRPKAGLNIGYLVNASSKIGGEKRSEKINDNNFDFGLGIGLEYNLPMGVFFDANFNFGVTNLAQEKGSTVKNRTFQIGVGYKF